MQSPSKRLLFALPLIVLGTFSLLYFGALAPEVIPSVIPGPVLGNQVVDAKLKHQVVTLGIALLVLTGIQRVAPQNARRFYRIGNLNAPAAAVKWLGIRTNETWKRVGCTFAVIVSLATGLFTYFNLARGQSIDPQNLGLIPVILLLSTMNAFTEEAITRLSVVTALEGVAPRPIIYWVSALVFGIPHYFGFPGGILGSLMAGFLGWLLAKSIAETEGMAWAWFIHFLQDVIIFGGMLLLAV